MSRRNEKQTATIANQERNCRSCANLDNSRMVQCDKCDEWHHFDCVGTTAEVEQQQWFCPKCQATKTSKKKSKTTKALANAPSVSTQANILFQNVPSVNTSHSSETLDTTVINEEANKYIHGTCPSTQSCTYTVTQTASNSQLPPPSFMPQITYLPNQPPITSGPSVINSPRIVERLNPLGLPNVSVSFAPLSSNLSIPPCETTSLNSRVMSLNSEVIPAQCTTVTSCSNMPIPALQYHTPLSSRNLPTSVQLEMTSMNIVAEVPNNLVCDKPQGLARATSRTSRTSSRSSVNQKRLQLELQILEEEKRLQEEYLKKKHALMRELASDSSSSIASVDGKPEEEREQALGTKVHQWIQGVQQAAPVIITNGANQEQPCTQTVPTETAAQQCHQAKTIVPEFSSMRISRAEQLPSRIGNLEPNAVVFNPAQQSTPRNTA